jgi:UDP-N-acetylglucosamine--N-acetylmuramyl-(pentapeptide) pyrophosphoryl-undecaprenol N-acetylglucosamine transferase
MRVLFAGGGTAGHINPAISVANYIKEKDDNFEALFIGTRHGLETKLVPKAGYKIQYIDVVGFNRKKLYKNVSAVYKLMRARADSKKILKEFKPDVVVCTGGYVSGPVCMAAGKLGIPCVIHEQNVYPGLTVRGSEKYVSRVLVSFDETVKHMKSADKCVVTGNPIRGELLRADRRQARASLELGDEPFVLVFGGSLGADKINNVMIGVLKRLQKERGFTVLFGTGERNFAAVQRRFKNNNIEVDDNIRLVPYIDNMAQAMAACDLVVSRAGAITVSEIAALGKPSVLIPSPNVVRNHQEQNARELERGGASVVITEDMLTSDKLYREIKRLVNDEELLDKMSLCARNMAKTDALDMIYGVLREITKD